MSPLPAKTKLLLVLSLILITAFTATSIVNYRVSRDAVIRELATSALPLTRDNIYSEILKALMEPINVSSLMANDSFLKEWCEEGEHDVGKIIRYLDAIQKKYGFFSAFFVSARTGNYYHSNGILKKISPDDEHDVWFYNFTRSGLEYVLDVDTNQAEQNVLTVFINFRVTDKSGALLGVTGVGLKMDMLAQLIRKTQDRYHRGIFLTDVNGLIQAHSDISMVERANIVTTPGIDSVAAKVLDKDGGKGNLVYETGNGTTMMLISRYIPELNWFLVVEQNQDEALEAARANMFRTLGAGLAASLTVIVIIAMTLKRYQGRLEILARSDELTGAFNRRAFEEAFNRAVARRGRTNTSFCFILLDLDHFKQVNDHYGHLKGDEILVSVARIAQAQIRTTDTLARWGGDEFLILAECPPDQARAMAERILASIRDARMGEIRGRHVTASCGVAEYLDQESLDATLARADKSMFAAKDSGRNSVSG